MEFLDGIQKPRSLREIEETDQGYLPVGLLAIQRTEAQDYINGVCSLIGVHPEELHMMGSDEIHQRIEQTQAQAERAA